VPTENTFTPAEMAQAVLMSSSWTPPRTGSRSSTSRDHLQRRAPPPHVCATALTGVAQAPADDGCSGGRAGWRGKKSTRSLGKSAQTASRARLGVIDTVEIGLPIRDVAVSPDGAVAYVASCCPEVGAVVDVIDTRTNKIAGTRKIGEIRGILTGLTLSRDGDRAYLVSDDSITVLCALTQDVIGTVRVTKQPSCVVESPDGKSLYIADYSGAVSVISVVSVAPLAIEGAAQQSDASAAWAMPELLKYEPALA
jgi:DNA-binding beta-propeller fold protein YncE